MNTKQLWNALTLNYYTTSYFDGIYSVDMLKEIVYKPRLIICNTDPSDKPGKHWLLFMFKEDIVEFYDPLGRDLKFYNMEFVTFVKRFVSSYEMCTKRTQPIGSSLCGEFCLYYAYGTCRGYNMREIINSMTSASKIVNFVYNTFFICYSSKCSLLQTNLML